MESLKNINLSADESVLSAQELEELEMLESDESLRLTAPQDRFGNADMLRRLSADDLTREEMIVACAEGDLNEKELHMAGLTENIATMRRMKLQPDLNVVFTNKERLRHTVSLLSLKTVLWTGVAAAVIALAILPMLKPGIDPSPNNPVISDNAGMPKTAVDSLEKQDKRQIASTLQPESETPSHKPEKIYKTIERSVIEVIGFVHDQEILPVATLGIEPAHALNDKLPVETLRDNLFTDSTPADSVQKSDKNYMDIMQSLVRETQAKNRWGGRILSAARSSLDDISEKRIIAVNSLLSIETTVIKKYDPEGNLITRNVESSRSSFSRNYKE